MIWDLDKLDLGQAKFSPVTLMQYARQLIEDGDAASLAEAAKIYEAALADPSLSAASPHRSEIQSLYGSLLCLQAQNETDGEIAAHQLETAHLVLTAALLMRNRSQMPQAWATTSANLALVYTTRYARTGNAVDVMAAHMALDGTLEVFAQANDAASVAWVQSVRDHLIKLAERRNNRR